jgi:2-C-methyl-D-erythritol 2,4-cyclodiphosphate synthase
MFRVGFGYDSHRFAPDRPLVLAGVDIPSAAGLAGHSDADAALHALIDALLGAAGMGDIGEQFPDDDPRYAGADSAEMVDEVMRRIRSARWAPVNVDLTILAEVPKLSPYKTAMRDRVAGLLAIDPAAVAVKAKTNERMGPVGRGEGLAAMAVVLIARDGG